MAGAAGKGRGEADLGQRRALPPGAGPPKVVRDCECETCERCFSRFATPSRMLFLQPSGGSKVEQENLSLILALSMTSWRLHLSGTRLLKID